MTSPLALAVSGTLDGCRLRPSTPSARSCAPMARPRASRRRGSGGRSGVSSSAVSTSTRPLRVDDHVRATAALLVAPRGTVVARHTAASLWGGAPPHDWRTHVTTLWPGAAERAAAAEARRRVRGGGRGCSTRARDDLEWGRMDVDGVDARVSSNRAGIVSTEACA